MDPRDLSLSLADALLRSQTPPSEDARRARTKPPFTIAISREAGGLGKTVAEIVGKRLNWPVYDQELINKVAEEMGRPSFHVRGVDEKYFSWLEEVMSNLLADSFVNPRAYLRDLIATIRGLGAVGKCVIVGRGSTFILPPENTLRVRLVGDLPDRILAVGRRLGISDKEAVRWIEKTERERMMFVMRNFGKDPSDPHYYNMVVNTSVTPAEDAAELIITALHQLEHRRESKAAPREEETLALR